jgi:N-acyl-D-amino-acid deacylase
MKQILFLLSLCAVLLGHARAEMPNDVESATRRGLARVKQAASDWQKHKTCFSCHHQTLPMLAALEAERVGFPLDKPWLKSQGDTTHRYFEDRIEMLEEAERLPGGAATTGFGFWALLLDRRPADDTTTAMVKYLLQIQGVKRADERDPDKPASVEDGRWIATCRRQPMQASMIADTVLVLMGMEKYATPEQRPRVTEARAKADKWLAQAPLRDQQDRLWRLWGLHHLGGDGGAKKKTLAAILAAQRDDGGWAETKERESDAYSTGQTLFMLLKTGTASEHPSVARARDYLLKTQHADGSWLAESHVTFKAQPHFENGDPHGEHQFLSTAATAWATAGLAQLLPPKPAAPPP